MVTLRKCLCERGLKSKCKNNPSSKKRKLSLVQVVVMVQKGSLNLQVSAHLWYAVQILTIQASRFVPKVSKPTHLILLMEDIHHTAGKVKSKEIRHKMASLGCSEEVQTRIQEPQVTHTKRDNLTWLTECKQKIIDFYRPSITK